jgi:hypothetical protein
METGKINHLQLFVDDDILMLCPVCAALSNRHVDINCEECGCAGLVTNPAKMN